MIRDLPHAAMSEHNRREVYWQYYEPAKEVEASRLRSALIEIIQESHYPRQEKQQQGSSTGSLQGETGLCLSADDGRQRSDDGSHVSTGDLSL